jgi:hypothetical protein
VRESQQRAFAAALVALSTLIASPARADHALAPDSVVEGPLTVVRATDKTGQVATTLYRVGDTAVKFEHAPPVTVASGTWVRVRGLAGATGLEAHSGADVSVVAAAPAPSSSGVQRAAILLVNFRDRAVPVSASAASGLAASVDGWLRETSFGKASLTASVFGPFTIAFDSTSTDYWEWSRAADDAALASGVDLSSFPRRVYVLADNAIDASGYGTIGGRPSRAWIFNGNASTLAHELGHNLGLEHASTPTDEYGDASCAMGSPWALVHFNAPHKAQLGWVTATDVSSTTTQVIAHLATATTEPQALRLAKADTGERYYVSTRKAIGLDANLASRYRDRTEVHRYGGEKTYLLATLGDGESFQDAVNGITITQLSHDALHATVSVSLGRERAVRVKASTLNVRDGPMGAVLGTVSLGQVFVRAGGERDGFVEVFEGGGRGWISAGYVEGVSATGGRVTATQLNVRAGPSTNDAVLVTLAQGDLYADAPGGDGSWRAIQLDGRVAFISRAYTSDVGLAP